MAGILTRSKAMRFTIATRTFTGITEASLLTRAAIVRLGVSTRQRLGEMRQQRQEETRQWPGEMRARVPARLAASAAVEKREVTLRAAREVLAAARGLVVEAVSMAEAEVTAAEAGGKFDLKL
jgi:hypothetical protein